MSYFWWLRKLRGSKFRLLEDSGVYIYMYMYILHFMYTTRWFKVVSSKLVGWIISLFKGRITNLQGLIMVITQLIIPS